MFVGKKCTANSAVTVLPKIKYFTGYNNKFGNETNSSYEFYNIFRDKSTTVHAKKQQKISHNFNIRRETINYNSRILFDASISALFAVSPPI